MKIFVGYDPREDITYQVCEHSIKRRNKDVDVVPLKMKLLRESGIYTREIDRLASTEFTFTRFFIPYLQNYQGWAVFCDCDFVWQIDADELPSVDLLEMLPSILESNPDLDVYLVPRINTVSGITEEHIQEWRWRVEGDRINFPDYQWRIYKNISSIKWINKVHERLDGFKTYSILPPQDEFCLLHPKTIERQEQQNEFYNTI